MMSQPQDRHKATVIKLHGRFDAYAVPQLKARIGSILISDKPLIVLDFGEVNFIDSTALCLLVQATRQCHAHGGEMAICGVSQPLRLIIEMIRLDRVLAIHANESSALSALQQRHH